MECKRCLVDIPSVFEFAFAQNICPKCGKRLMADTAMNAYIDLKKRLQEVEFVMDKNTVCDRIAMFVVTNYEVLPLNSLLAPAESKANGSKKIDLFKEQIASLDEDVDLSPEEIRAEEAARAEDIASAREMGLNVDNLDGEEMISGSSNAERVQRLKKLAMSNRAGVMVKRSE